MDEDAQQMMSWAMAVGTHPLLFFGGLLFVLLALTTAGWAAWLRLGQRSRSAIDRASPLVWLATQLAVGVAVVLAAAALFAEMLEWSDAEDVVGLFDSTLARALGHSMPPAALRVFAWLTHLGDPPWLTVVVVAASAWLVWQRRIRLAVVCIAAGAGNGILNRVLKQIFERVRPIHEHGFAVADGFSFPSGHTSGAVVVYGMLVILVLRMAPVRWHLALTLPLIAMIFAIACSRVLLQVHWASDVLAGFASGLAWLTVCVVAGRPWHRTTRTGDTPKAPHG